jgi:hypothetical protein
MKKLVPLALGLLLACGRSSTTSSSPRLASPVEEANRGKEVAYRACVIVVQTGQRLANLAEQYGPSGFMSVTGRDLVSDTKSDLEPFAYGNPSNSLSDEVTPILRDVENSVPTTAFLSEDEYTALMQEIDNAIVALGCHEDPFNTVFPQTSPSPSEPLAEWTHEQKEEIAQILANGIKHSIPLATRLAAGRCAAPRFTNIYPTFHAFLQGSTFAPNGRSKSTEALFRDLKVLGRCENKVGI